MQSLQMLRKHIAQRIDAVQKAKQEGVQIVGYTLGGFFPEEILIAAGMIPLGMIAGGSRTNVDRSGAYVCRWLDTFWRSQIGAALSGRDPYFEALDLLVIPVTDNHVRAFADLVVYYGGMNVFSFGVPHTKQNISSLEYYLNGIKRLKKKLEEIKGSQIGDEALLQAVRLCNEERRLLRDLSFSRASSKAPIRSQDFIELNHGSFLLDKSTMLEILNQAKTELSAKSVSKGPRILLTGSTLSLGDSKVQDLIEEAGGLVVFEEFAEGIKPYRDLVNEHGELMRNLAEFYFWNRIPPAWFRPDKERLEELVRLCRSFKVDGIVWYHLMFRESYKTESMYFPERIKHETGIPVLILESDYDSAEIGQMRTRIETFITTLRKS